MVAALLIPLVAVTLGTALSVIGGSRPRVLLPIRAFALAAVVASVSLHLVPEALAAVGAWVLIAFAAGLWLPLWLGHLRRDLAERGRHRQVASELGFAAVLVHQVGDGVALGALGTSAGTAGANWDLLIGILAHTVPLAAVVTLPFVDRGLRSVAVRAGLLVAASGVGVIGAEALSALSSELLPWFSALVAGTLLHILAHDEPAIARPAGARWIEVGATLAGVALPAVLAHDAEAGLLSTLADLALPLAPALALGFAVTLVLRAGAGARSTRLGALGGFVDALREPSCACEVHASSERAPSRAELVFLLSAPELHVGTLVATAWLFGGRWTAVRVGAAMLVAFVAAHLMRGDARAPRAPIATRAPWSSLPVRDQLAETFVHAGPWLVAGLVVAAWLAAALPPAWLAPAQGALWLPAAVVAIAALTYVCAWAATPVAAVLVAKGLAPGLAVLGLIAGTVSNRDVVRALTARLGARAYLALGAVIAALTAAATLAAAQGVYLGEGWSAAGWRAPRWLEWACAGALLAGALLSLWRYGLTAWLEPLLSDARGHQHHQHADEAPCQDGCHDAPLAEEPRAHGHEHHGHAHHGHAHHGPEHHGPEHHADASGDDHAHARSDARAHHEHHHGS